MGASLAAAYLLVLRAARRARAGADGPGPAGPRARDAARGGRRDRAGVPQRLERAAALVEAGAAADVVVLGGRTGRHGPSEAEAGSAYLVARGVPAGRIATEDTSRHTLENLLRYRAAFGADGRVVLVTSRSHLARAGLMARDLGIGHDLCAAEPAWRTTPAALASVLGEAFFAHWYVVGRIYARLTRDRRMLARLGG
jgi:uncharacterized SAM-binding protein YcdF (DUF218 family)